MNLLGCMKVEIMMVDRIKVADLLTLKQGDISDYLDGCDVVTRIFKTEKRQLCQQDGRI